MTDCSTDKEYTFVFDLFSQSLVWLANKADFEQYGISTVTIMEVPLQNDFSTHTVYFRKRKSNNLLQKWAVLYPTQINKVVGYSATDHASVSNEVERAGRA